MAGLFTRLNYDNDAYREKNNRSTYNLGYRINNNYSNYGNTNTQNYMSNNIDTDSNLRGINRINTKSNENSKSHMPSGLMEWDGRSQNSNRNLETEYSRFTHPKHDIRGNENQNMRLGFPLHNPQCNIFENTQINTRLEAKDNFVATWQTPMDQSSILPTGK